MPDPMTPEGRMASLNAWFKSTDPTATMLRDATERLDGDPPDVLGAKVSLHGATMAVGLYLTGLTPLPKVRFDGGVERRKVWFQRPVVYGNPAQGERQIDTYFYVSEADGALEMTTRPEKAGYFTREELAGIKAKFPSDWTYYFGDDLA